MRTLRIGIDPGKDTTGVFVWDFTQKKVVASKTMGYLKAPSFVDLWPPEMVQIVRIEDPGLNKFAYSRNVNGNPAQSMKIQRNVGMNQQIAHFLIETLRQRGYRVEAVRPAPQHKKWKSAFYQAATKDNSRISQHVRDAARMVV